VVARFGRYAGGMARVRVFHWKAEEAGALLDTLRAAGHQIDYEERIDYKVMPALKRAPPDAVVIDLSRLPSHGRECATALRGHKATRLIPIVFVDGLPEKVEAVRRLLPDAVYTSRGRLVSALKRAIAKGAVDPVVPAQMMERYAGKAACAKLGIGVGARVAVMDPPGDYVAVLGEAPEGVRFEEEGSGSITLWFVDDLDGWRGALRRIRGVAGRGKVWVVWRMGTGGVTLRVVGVVGAAVGLVDYKICSVNDTWSAMLFARR
jgi:CheY-like chemotaxis protein